MKKYQLLATLSVVAVLLLGLNACKKTDAITIAPERAHFTNMKFASYEITAPNKTYKIPIGITNVSTQDRTVNIQITSPSGAQQGTHYTVNTKSIVIPAGKAVDSIVVSGVYNQYTSGRKDTLVFTITQGGVPPAEYNQTFTLLMRGPCFEGDIVLNELLGTYANTNEVFGSSTYGPYTTQITAVNKTSATTGTITVANIYDYGWNPITFKLDWTDPNNRTLTLDQQAGIGDAGTLNSAYSGQDISVRPYAGQTGTFSYCNQTFTIKMQVGVTGLGWFGSLYTVNLAR